MGTASQPLTVYTKSIKTFSYSEFHNSGGAVVSVSEQQYDTLVIANSKFYDITGTAISVTTNSYCEFSVCKFKRIRSQENGGAMALYGKGSSYQIFASQFNDTSSTLNGGAIYAENAAVDLYQSDFNLCTAANGGIVYFKA